MTEEIIFILGPTAAGKTEAAIYLAKKLRTEIISIDSMQVYRAMDILTSKPSPHNRKKVKHHLINFLPLNKRYDASQYRKQAIKKVDLFLKRGLTPLFVGGTGLYASMLLDGIFNLRKPDDSIRKKLYRSAGKYGSGYLYKRLARIDKEAALKIHPNDLRRIVRALEVFESSGRPISELQKERTGLRDRFRVKIVCLNIKRAALYDRINRRVDKMFKQGAVKEVAALLKKKLSMTAQAAIGIKEIKGYLKGEYGLDEAKLLMKRNTRRYAKRQLTWFRKDKTMEWIDLSGKESPRQVADIIWKKLY